MSQQELLKTVVTRLTEAGIEYMMTGSLASSLQGEPRATHDIDVVVSVRLADVPALLAAFPSPAFYLSPEAVSKAVQSRGMFNAIEVESGSKIDFRLLTDTPFDRSRFARRRREPALGLLIAVSSPEDTILAKLWWASRCGGSEKQMGDALRVYEVQHGCLDLDHLESWATKLGVSDLWRRIQDEARPI